jgi:tRNA 2-selenouridine synthase SelU
MRLLLDGVVIIIDECECELNFDFFVLIFIFRVGKTSLMNQYPFGIFNKTEKEKKKKKKVKICYFSDVSF